MANLDLVKINIVADDSIKEFLEEFPDAKDEVDDYLKSERDKLTLLALQAFKSQAPVLTRELRNIDLKKSVKGLTGTVYIADLTHVNTLFKRRKPQAPGLAQVLDSGIENGVSLHRRANAIPAGPFVGPSKGASTANWLRDSESLLESFLNS